MERIKSKVDWIKYDIDWLGFANKSCKHCFGRGFEGYSVNDDQTRDIILCRCIEKKWASSTDEERLKHATIKENADEIMKKAKAVVKEALEEIKENK